MLMVLSEPAPAGTGKCGASMSCKALCDCRTMRLIGVQAKYCLRTGCAASRRHFILRSPGSPGGSRALFLRQMTLEATNHAQAGCEQRQWTDMQSGSVGDHARRRRTNSPNATVAFGHAHERKSCELTVKEHLAPRFDLVSWAGKPATAWWESLAAWLHMIKAVP